MAMGLGLSASTSSIVGRASTSLQSSAPINAATSALVSVGSGVNSADTIRRASAGSVGASNG